jgi:hypothetical protein
MGKVFSHLVAQDRDMIAVLKSEGKSLGKIARMIGKHKSTVSRELIVTPTKFMLRGIFIADNSFVTPFVKLFAHGLN